MTVATKSFKNPVASNSGLTEHGKFLSLNEIIDIYEKGCKDGYTNVLKDMKKQLEKNLTSAQQIAEKFLAEINNENPICNTIFLRVNDLSKFDLLYAINPDIFYNPKLSSKFYEMGIELEDENDMVSISFLPSSENLNTHMLIADRYLFFYAPKESN